MPQLRLKLGDKSYHLKRKKFLKRKPNKKSFKNYIGEENSNSSYQKILVFFVGKFAIQFFNFYNL